MKWNCKDILDLTYPIHPTENDKGSLHNFDQCVLEAIPKLPDNITPKEIAEAFNSRYFARNIALAVKYISNDIWVKADNYLLKKLFDNNLKRVDLSDKKLKDFETKRWGAKNDDVSIAATAISSQDNFDRAKPKSNEQPFFKRDLSKHSSALEHTFKNLTNQTFQKIKI